MKLLLKRLLSRFSTSLPVGMTEFNVWADSIIELSGPLADAESMKYVLASQIINGDPKTSKAPKAYFVSCLRKAAAKQIAGAVFQEIQAASKKRQQEAIAAEQTPEATAPNEVAPPDGDDSQKN